MSYVPPLYSPSMEVKAAHAVPRFTMSGSISEDNSWNFTSIADVATGADYAIAAITLPAVLIVLGLVALFFFNFLICCRCCCRCLKCAPSEDDIMSNPEKVIKSRHRVIFFFAFFLLLMILADHLLYYGNADIDKGADNLIDASERLSVIFTAIVTQTDIIVSYISDITTILDVTNTCKDYVPPFGQPNPAAYGLGNMSLALNVLSSAVGDIGKLAKPVPGQLESMSAFVELYLKTHKQTALFGVYCIAMALAILYIVGTCLASKCILIITVLVSELLVLTLTILCGILFMVITFYGDFCMQPIVNLRNLAPGESLKDIVSYFGFCSTADPFAIPITTAQSGIAELASAITIVGNECSNVAPIDDPLWVYATGNTTLINGAIGNIGLEVSCEPLNKIFTLFINDALCTNAFGGLYKFWIAEYFVSAMLFFVMIMASVLWQYFGEAWHLKPQDQHTGHHGQLDNKQDELAVAAPVDSAGGYKEEYTFTAAAPSAPAAITKKDIEMI